MPENETLPFADVRQALREDIQVENTLIVGGRVHSLVRVPPLILPIGLSLLWLYASCFAPHP